MSKTIIKVENLGKRYQIGEGQKFYTLRDSINNLFDFRKNKSRSEEFWALKDVNFEVKQGESIGIIGRNGAGKSTLLKILSQITPPTTGKITMQGRVASLLEVGTGFHQELTGRENIFLNGAILGMNRQEIKRKFDEIVAFSEIEKFLDTTVKHYSSGMYMRLAFAVAAHLESEILIVDEVLAVGDAQFQKKCLGKMDEVAKEEGKTVLFVSHNLAAIQQLCQKGMILSNGQLTHIGKANEIVDRYISMSTSALGYSVDGFVNLEQTREKVYKAKIFNKIRILDNNNKRCETFPMLSSMKIEVELINTENFPRMDYGISIMTTLGQRITSYATWMYKKKKDIPRKILLEIPKINFSSGNYQVYLSATNPREGIYIDKIENAIRFSVESIDIFNTGRNFDADYGLILPDGNFSML